MKGNNKYSRFEVISSNLDKYGTQQSAKLCIVYAFLTGFKMW